MDSSPIFVARAPNVPVWGFRIRISILSKFYCFIHSVSLTFSSKSSYLIIPHKSLKNMDSYSVFVALVSNVPIWGFRIRVTISSTFLLLYTLHLFDILFLIIMPNHSPQKVLKTWPVTQFFSTCFKRPGFEFLN